MTLQTFQKHKCVSAKGVSERNRKCVAVRVHASPLTSLPINPALKAAKSSIRYYT